jgi:hypothetical protein
MPFKILIQSSTTNLKAQTKYFTTGYPDPLLYPQSGGEI